MKQPYVLIIEDERDVAALFRHVIDMAGYQTEVVTSGEIALKRLSSSQPAIIILDLKMPGVSGGEILEFIRDDERLSDTKVIVITAYPHIAEGLAEKTDLILLKPVSIEQITEFIGRFESPEKSKKVVPLQQEPLDDRTGLYNQPFFKHRLESSLKQASDIEGFLFGVILFKVEPISKQKNKADIDQWVYVLREVAESLKSILRPTDTLARFDQDHFYVLLEDVPNKEIAIEIANRIHERLRQDIAEKDNKFQFPVRIGILLCDRGYKNVDEVLRNAKHARNLASAQGVYDSKPYYLLSDKK